MELDFSRLRAEGLALVQRLAGGSWTDHNTHDPGITILEQLCYALTDLDYRARYDLPDLLASGGADSYASLYGPAELLPIDPVTLTDLRKLVIDVPGVSNAWIDLVDEPLARYDAVHGEVSWQSPGGGPGDAEISPNVSDVRVRGLYRVLIEKSELEDLDGGWIRLEAARRLHRHRGLCEDFVEIALLETQRVPLGATLEIDPVQDTTVLLADVYRAISAYMSPAVPFHTLEEMQERGWRIDQIFEGPLLEHGFIDTDELARFEPRDSLRVSDLIHALMAVPGVVAVKNVHFLEADGTASPDWLLAIDRARTPRFDLEHSEIRLEKRTLRVDAGIREGAQALYVKREGGVRPRLGSVPSGPALRPAPGRDRNVGRYYPVQKQFPVAYGVGSAGLPPSASPERRAQALQLKAYLMFFEQILANQQAQLANAGRLFSFDDETADSYFAQPVPDDGTLGLEAILASGAEHEERLRLITEDPASGARRRNRFLDHLLARFGEQFRNYSLVQADADAPDERLARDKRAFLRDFPAIGRRRGTAFDCLAPETDGAEENISGLELLLRRKLGIATAEERFYLVEHILLRPVAGDADQEGPLFRAAQSPDPYSLQITFVFPAAAGRYKDENFQRFVEQTVREETPAHLAIHVAWRDAAAMEAFAAAYSAWTRELRRQRLAEWGIAP